MSAIIGRAWRKTRHLALQPRARHQFHQFLQTHWQLNQQATQFHITGSPGQLAWASLGGQVMAGKTLGDVLYGVIREPRLFFSATLLLSTLCIVVILSLVLLARIFGLTIVEIGVPPRNSGIVFRESGATPELYDIGIHPNGWQDARIVVDVGDRLFMQFDGRINVDMPGLVENSRRRLALEVALTSRHRLDRQSFDPTTAPERRFSLDPTFARSWNGPEGINEAILPRRAFAARIPKRIVPTAPLGALLIAIVPEGQAAPARADAFAIGATTRPSELVIKQKGSLWFIVNDVWDDEDPRYPHKFFDDNLGFFVAHVAIRRAR